MSKDTYIYGYQVAMEEVAKRTCSSCKHYIERRCFIISDYTNTTRLDEYVNEDFGCNKYEPKDV